MGLRHNFTGVLKKILRSNFQEMNIQYKKTHLGCYRIKKNEKIMAIGVDDFRRFLESSTNIILCKQAQKMRPP